MLKLSPVDKSIIAEATLAELPLVGDLYKFYRVGDAIYAWSELATTYIQVNGGGGGSIPQAKFLTLEAHAGLDNERVFAPGENIQSNDAGAGASYEVSMKLGATIPNGVDFSTTGKSNNISPTGWNDAWATSTGTGRATILNYTGTDYAIISGLTGGVEGRICMFVNKSEQLVIIEHNSDNSSAANRINSKNGIAIFLSPGRSIFLQYCAGAWQMLFGDLWTAFDDFTGLQGTWTGPVGSFNALGVSTTSSVLAPSQYGIISAAPTAGARSFLGSSFGGPYAPTSGDPAYPVVFATKVYLSALPSTFARLAIGVGNFISGAGSFYTTGACNGTVFGYGYDSGIPNATTNWFIYSGLAGSAANVAAGALDSGIPISQCVNAWNVFVIYFDYKNNIYKFFHSPDMKTYNYVGLRTTRSGGATFGWWYEATNASRPTMWTDWAGISIKFSTRR
jgi:hypothetical protein